MNKVKVNTIVVMSAGFLSIHILFTDAAQKLSARENYVAQVGTSSSQRHSDRPGALDYPSHGPSAAPYAGVAPDTYRSATTDRTYVPTSPGFGESSSESESYDWGSTDSRRAEREGSNDSGGFYSSRKSDDPSVFDPVKGLYDNSFTYGKNWLEEEKSDFFKPVESHLDTTWTWGVNLNEQEPDFGKDSESSWGLGGNSGSWGWGNSSSNDSGFFGSSSGSNDSGWGWGSGSDN